MATNSRWIRALCIAATTMTFVSSCRDATAPDGALEVVVTPETVKRSSDGAVTLDVVFRNQSAEWVIVSCACPVVQTETAPAAWSSVDSLPTGYIQDYLAGPIQPKAQRGKADYGPAFLAPLKLVPGRYRLRYEYHQTDASGTPRGTSGLQAYSNIFVVVP